MTEPQNDDEPQDEPESPHDALFKTTFGRPEHAAGELRTVLPQELVSRIDFSTLEVRRGSYVDRELKRRESDILYAVRMDDDELLIYALFEHQSSAHPRMPLRLLGYMVRIWEEHAARHPAPSRLPPIVPMVLHHDYTGWQAATRLSDLLAAGPATLRTLAPYTPDFAFVLDDLARVDGNSLRVREHLSAMARLVLFVLQRARHAEDLASELETWGDVMAELAARPNGTEDLAVVVRYTYFVADIAPARVRAILRGRVSPETEEALMTTTAERLMAEGEARGRAAGEARMRALLLKQLTLKYGVVPPSFEERVRNASVAELDLWAERFVMATTLESIFA